MSNENPHATTTATSATSKASKPRRMAREPNAESVVSAGTAGAPTPAPRTSKQTLVLGLLGRPDGATLAELMGATGWLAHSTRAALTGLRKKGHVIERSSRDGVSCYHAVSK